MILSSLVALAMVTSATAAVAQLEQGAPARERAAQVSAPKVTAADGATYTVEFRDDPIAAALEDGNLPRIQVRGVRSFGQLSRPRLHFVPEMLKSVEVM